MRRSEDSFLTLADLNDYEGGNDHEGDAALAVPGQVDGW